MSLQSMTGFARAQGLAECGLASGKWTWEFRSVNAKGLDVRLRLPSGFDAIESQCRKTITEALTRGNIQASLLFERQNGGTVPSINQGALEAVLDSAEQLRERIGGAPLSLDAIIAIKGVLEFAEEEASEEEIEARNVMVLNGLNVTLDDLSSARRSEGVAISGVLEDQLSKIGDLVEVVENDPSRTPLAIRERLEAQLAPLIHDASQIDPQRLHQEAAMLATKADLREEIDRLKAHVEAGRELITAGGPVGRKLDFLAQEFNRECNTICSKSNARTVTTAGLEMKVLIDQFREQIQNLE